MKLNYFLHIVTNLILNYALAKPTGSKVFMLMLDGFVYNFEKFASMPNLKNLERTGVRAERMIPSFPSETLPTVATLMTGLYTESHGILNNKFRDVGLNIFNSKEDDNGAEISNDFTMQEPIWFTNQKQEGTSAVYYVPNFVTFQKSVPKYHNRLDAIPPLNIVAGLKIINHCFKLLKSDSELNLVIVYINAPDEVGHGFGTDSKQYKRMLEGLDKHIISRILTFLSTQSDLNFILTADHGLFNTNSIKQIYYLEDYLVSNSFKVLTTGPMCVIWPANGYTVQDILGNITVLNDTNGFKVYRREDLPEYLHYKNNKDIPPIAILADPDHLLVQARNSEIKPGVHGNDIADTDSSTIFFAQGPAFKENVVLKPFESVNVVPLIAHLLGIQPQPNNGSLSPFSSALKEGT